MLERLIGGESFVKRSTGGMWAMEQTCSLIASVQNSYCLTEKRDIASSVFSLSLLQKFPGSGITSDRAVFEGSLGDFKWTLSICEVIASHCRTVGN